MMGTHLHTRAADTSSLMEGDPLSLQASAPEDAGASETLDFASTLQDLIGFSPTRTSGSASRPVAKNSVATDSLSSYHANTRTTLAKAGSEQLVERAASSIIFGHAEAGSYTLAQPDASNSRAATTYQSGSYRDQLQNKAAGSATQPGSSQDRSFTASTPANAAGSKDRASEVLPNPSGSATSFHRLVTKLQPTIDPTRQASNLSAAAVSPPLKQASESISSVDLTAFADGRIARLTSETNLRDSSQPQDSSLADVPKAPVLKASQLEPLSLRSGTHSLKSPAIEVRIPCSTFPGIRTKPPAGESIQGFESHTLVTKSLINPANGAAMTFATIATRLAHSPVIIDEATPNHILNLVVSSKANSPALDSYTRDGHPSLSHKQSDNLQSVRLAQEASQTFSTSTHIRSENSSKSTLVTLSDSQPSTTKGERNFSWAVSLRSEQTASIGPARLHTNASRDASGSDSDRSVRLSSKGAAQKVRSSNETAEATNTIAHVGAAGLEAMETARAHDRDTESTSSVLFRSSELIGVGDRTDRATAAGGSGEGIPDRGRLPALSFGAKPQALDVSRYSARELGDRVAAGAIPSTQTTAVPVADSVVPQSSELPAALESSFVDSGAKKSRTAATTSVASNDAAIGAEQGGTETSFPIVDSSAPHTSFGDSATLRTVMPGSSENGTHENWPATDLALNQSSSEHAGSSVTHGFPSAGREGCLSRATVLSGEELDPDQSTPATPGAVSRPYLQAPNGDRTPTSQVTLFDGETRRPALSAQGTFPANPNSLETAARPGHISLNAATAETPSPSPQLSSSLASIDPQANPTDLTIPTTLKPAPKPSASSGPIAADRIFPRDDELPVANGVEAEAAPVRSAQEAAPSIGPGRVANLKIELNNGDTAHATVRERAGSIEVKIVTPTSASAQRVASEIDSMRQNLDAVGLRLAHSEVSYQQGNGKDGGREEHQRPSFRGRGTDEQETFTLSEVIE